MKKVYQRVLVIETKKSWMMRLASSRPNDEKVMPLLCAPWISQFKRESFSLRLKLFVAHAVLALGEGVGRASGPIG